MWLNIEAFRQVTTKQLFIVYLLVTSSKFTKVRPCTFQVKALKSVQVMVRLHIFPIFSFLAKMLSFLHIINIYSIFYQKDDMYSCTEKTTFLPEMKITEKYASGP